MFKDRFLLSTDLSSFMSSQLGSLPPLVSRMNEFTSLGKGQGGRDSFREELQPQSLPRPSLLEGGLSGAGWGWGFAVLSWHLGDS